MAFPDISSSRIKTTRTTSRNPAVDELLSRTRGLWQSADRPAQVTQRARPGAINDLFADLDEPGHTLPSAQPQPSKPQSSKPHPSSEALRRYPDITARHLPQGQSTGSAQLDAILPWGGWPTSGLVEIITPHLGIGELQLLLPLLRERSQGQQSILWITPPYDLNGTMLSQSGMNLRNSFVIPSSTRCNQALWSIEKALQSAECTMVLAWQNWLGSRVLRRLQMAAAEGNTLGVLFHQRPVANSSACLQLRLSSVSRYPDGQRQLDVHLLKARGTHHRTKVSIPLPC